MKFSDAVVLGHTLVRFDPSVFLVHECGCLQGGAYKAATGKDFALSNTIAEQWGWLAEPVTDPRSPGKWYEKGGYFINALAFQIDGGDITFEQAIHLIQQVEPLETSTENVQELPVSEKEAVCQSKRN